MVHINQVGLTQFKSFGGAMTIPLEQGLTVVTGPNGSGKSNILDGVLFCLGLATSRGMRADRLPDLINSAVLKDRSPTKLREVSSCSVNTGGPEGLCWFQLCEPCYYLTCSTT